MYEKVLSIFKRACNEHSYLKEKKHEVLTEEMQESKNAKIFYTCKEKFENNIWKIKNIVKLVIIVIIQGNIEVLRIAYVI